MTEMILSLLHTNVFYFFWLAAGQVFLINSGVSLSEQHIAGLAMHVA